MTYQTALVVDDSKLARVTLRKKLEGNGLTVEFADSAEQAYRKIPELAPDIIFMDHLMPDIDGFQATTHIRQVMGVKTPIIMCTGKEHDSYLQEALAIGANHILGKPPVDEDLEAVLSMQFEAPSEPAEVEHDKENETEPAGNDDFDMQELSETLEAIDTLTDTLTADSEEPTSADEISQAATSDVAITEGLDHDQVQQLIRAQLADEKQAIMTELMTAWTAAADEQPLDETAVAGIVTDVLEKEKQSLLAEMQQMMEEQTRFADAGGDRDFVARMEEVLHPRLVELKSSLLADVEQRVGQGGGSAPAENDISDILDLRLDVLLAERMSTFDKRMQEMEEAMQSVTTPLPDDGIPMADGSEAGSRFMMSERIIKHLDQLIEENSLFAKQIRQTRLLAAGSLLLASVSVVAVAVLWLV